MSENILPASSATNTVVLSNTQATTLAAALLPYIHDFIASNREEFEVWKQERKSSVRGVNYAANK